MTAALLLLAALALVVACGIFVAAEFAFLAVDRPTIERLAAGGDRGAKGTLAALRKLSTQLSAVQVGITLTNLAIGLLSEPALATLLEGPFTAAGLPKDAVPSLAIAIALIVSTLVTMLLGELVPKNLAIALPVQVASMAQAPVRLFAKAIAWPIRWLNGLANLILRRFGMQAQEELASARSAEELLAVVRRSAQEGSLEGETATLLARSLVFGTRRAHDAMTPRVRLRTLAATDPVSMVIDGAVDTGHSRFPVTGESVDEIVGLVHVKQALGVARAARADRPVSSVMVAAELVPSSLPLDDVLDRLQERGLQMAVVIDEYGGTDGVITLEDVVEELLGELDDEFDRDVAAAVEARDGGWDVPGWLRPDEAAAALERTVRTGPWTTVAGMFLAQTGTLPQVGDAMVVDGVRWTVCDLAHRRIVTLHAEVLGEDDDDA